ncbi:hypothetical protein [Candidatus Albibeggiatoa sp. nov. NOAA]|uniref:hypothetical protein n=1 Tax=Candidatus Albibeggiatoa sp. nov. NOAA TaxID=3162724 RepID=UPI0032FDA723|nr:hypothetical protein [Thiotrichaceae bacterium]
MRAIAKLKTNLNSSIRFWYFVTFTILFLSILKGIRFPNTWSYTHFLFDYSFGFIKRGIVGEAIHQLNYPYLVSYEFFFIFSAAILSINIFLISLLLRDFIKSKQPLFIGCSLLFASSLAVVFLSHTIGYFDHIGLLVTLIAIRLYGFYKKIAFLLIAMPFSVLAHEATIIIFFPVIFMSLLFAIDVEGYRIKQTLILGVFSVAILVFTFFVGNNILAESEAQQMYGNVQANTEYPLRKDAFNVLYRNAKDNLSIMQHRWSNKIRLITLVQSFLVTAPIFIAFIYFSTLILIRKVEVQYYLIVLSILASLSPLILHLFAWDMHRWNTLTMVTSFLMLYIVYRSHLNNQPIIIPSRIYPLFFLLIFANQISLIPLFDGYYVKQFPFVEHQKYIIDLVYEKNVFPYVPNY